MGRRHGGHDFMPEKWVFPGGRIDRADFRAPFGSDLRPEVAARLAKTAPPPRARALALAAVRETFEEAGLLLATSAPSRPAAGPWREFLANGALPDLSALDFIARAVTPPAAPKRFDARFFMADAERLLSLTPLADCGELEEIAWVALGDALALDLRQRHPLRVARARSGGSADRREPAAIASRYMQQATPAFVRLLGRIEGGPRR